MENEFEALDMIEAAEEIDTRAWLCEFTRINMLRPAKERAYKMVQMYFTSGKTDREAHRKFIAWLTSGCESEAKEWALDRFFEEMHDAERSGLFPCGLEKDSGADNGVRPAEQG